MTSKAPGKLHRKGISYKQFFQMFPDDETAEAWFAGNRWEDEIRCPRCSFDKVQTKTNHKTMPYRCRKSKSQGCGRFFSVKTRTFMEASDLGYQDWGVALFLVATNLKSVSGMKLHRDVDVTQQTAWHMAHRIRKALSSGDGKLFEGPVEVDETSVGGKRRNRHNSKRKHLTGRGSVSKTSVVGVRDSDSVKVTARVVRDPTSETLQGFVKHRVVPGTTSYTDDSTAYTNLPNHAAVKHSVSEYVRGRVHANGIESFWSTLKRAHKDTFHRLSPKHLHRYVDEFPCRHNVPNFDTLEQMASIAAGMEESRLKYKDLVA